MSRGVRTRFAPAPSGEVHLGNARTALFNWLFARHHGGEFILRIDDTDQTRSTPQAIDTIVKSFKWLGLEWDEGPLVGGAHTPYFQSKRSDIYRRYAATLLESGAAYRCFCTREKIDEDRRAAHAAKRPYVYSGKCRDLSQRDRERMEKEGRTSVVRLRMGTGTLVVNDLIKGRIEFQRDLLSDEIIVRSDGRAMYNFASAVDDAEMKISHVIRADEHLSNTPKQIALCEALGVTPPEFAHVPMVLAPGGARKMSKREGAASLSWYIEKGYLASALRNYLARLGWSLDDRSELLSDEEVVAGFSLERVSSSAAALDPDKLLWMNAEYIRRMSIPERTDAVIPVLQREGLLEQELSPDRRLWLERVVTAIGDRLKVFSDIVEYAKFLFAGELEYDPRAVRKRLLKEGASEVLLKVREALSQAEPFDEEHVEETVRGMAEREGLSGGAVIHPTRVAVTGRAVGPGLFEALVLLGKEKTLARLDAAHGFIEKGEFPVSEQ